MRRTKFNYAQRLKSGDRVLFDNRKATVWEIVGNSTNRNVFIKYDGVKNEATAVQETALKRISE